MFTNPYRPPSEKVSKTSIAPISGWKLFIVVFLVLVVANFIAFAVALAHAFSDGHESALLSVAGPIASVFATPCILTRDYLISDIPLLGKFDDLIAFVVTTLAESLLCFYLLRWFLSKPRGVKGQSKV